MRKVMVIGAAVLVVVGGLAAWAGAGSSEGAHEAEPSSETSDHHAGGGEHGLRSGEDVDRDDADGNRNEGSDDGDGPGHHGGREDRDGEGHAAGRSDGDGEGHGRTGSDGDGPGHHGGGEEGDGEHR